MTALQNRKTKLSFETADEIREQGKYRPVVIDAFPQYCTVRLKGTRKTFTVTYGAIYHQAAKMAAQAEREAKKAKRGGR